MRSSVLLQLCLVILLLPGVRQASADDSLSLQQRIETAHPGDTLIVKSGTYSGPILIDKPLTLIGENRPHVVGDGQGHVVNIHSPRVRFEGFEVSGSGTHLNADHAGIMVEGNRSVVRNNHVHNSLHGIYIRGADKARIENNRIIGKSTVERVTRFNNEVPPGETTTLDEEEVQHIIQLPRDQRGNGIHLWRTQGNTIAYNTISDVRDGVYFSFADETQVTQNTIRDVRYGLHYMYSDHNTFENNVFYQCEAGAALMYSEDITVRENVFRDNRTHRGYGLLLQTVEDARIEGNRFLRNARGIYLQHSHRNILQRNTIAGNFVGFRITGSSYDNSFTENIIRANLRTMMLQGQNSTNEWQLNERGNYWSGRGLLDLDSDGVSELPYRTIDVLGEREENFPFVSFLTASPGVDVVSYALQRIPPPDAAMITDEFPLMRAPLIGDEETATTKRTIGFLLLVVLAVGTFMWQRTNR